MIDYTKFFEFYSQADDFFDSFQSKKQFIRHFYQYMLPGRPYFFKCKLFNEAWFIVDLANETGREIFLNGFIEKEVTNYLWNHIKPNDFFVDAGAAEGYYTAIASHKMLGRGHVIAIEPSPSIRSVFEMNHNANPIVTMCPNALCGHKKKVYLNYYGCNLSPYSTITEHPRFSGERAVVKKIPVTGLRLGSILSRNASEFVEGGRLWVKLDIEGAEDAVLRSSIDEIVARGAFVLFEVGFHGDSTKNLLLFLNSKPISLFQFDLYGINKIDSFDSFDFKKVQTLLIAPEQYDGRN